ncbi:MAG: VCBS repeat-containing protein [Planctomyces sp.]|nr:VCBS repeat-containing protein [Planctomyces sp.]
MVLRAILETLVACLCLSQLAAAADIGWQRVQLDARFRSEGVAIGDLNNDGRNDIVAGDVWYEAPNWTMREFRPVGDFPVGQGYSQSFCNWTYDINGDGWLDIIVVGFPGEPFHWYENPKGQPGHWKQHVIWHSICNETPQFRDLTGDGRPEVICGSQPESQMGYLEIPTGDAVYQRWTFTPISEPGEEGRNGTHRYYHGLGIADCNGDGRLDVVIPHGWWEHPETLGEAVWTFHPHALGPNGNPQTGADIYTVDLDLDGDPDFLMTCAHSYGVWWFENLGNGQVKQHTIDETFSQSHAAHYVDLNGDGERELVTGKRYYAHNGGDPGAYEPTYMHWFEIRREAGRPPQFVKHTIEESLDTGHGTQFDMGDIDGDGLIDIALANKKGVNLLLQRRPGGAAADAVARQ